MPPSSQHALIGACPPGAEQTTIRSLVHKRFPENVLLTDFRVVAEDHFVCAGRIPSEHPFFTDRGRTPCNDILFYTELGRQASLAVSHAFFNVDTEDVFIFERSEAGVTEAALRSSSQSLSADSVVIDIKVRETARRKNNVVTRIVADHRMSVANEQVFYGRGAWTMQSAALFKRLRKSSAGSGASDSGDAQRPAVDGYVARSHDSDPNVVISAPELVNAKSEFVASLVVDRTHPYFFDHPCDHVPGMLLLEGCAQLAQATCAESGFVSSTGPLVATYDVDFMQFVEVGLPTTLAARVDVGQTKASTVPEVAVHITISQHDVVCGTARLSVAFPI